MYVLEVIETVFMVTYMGNSSTVEGQRYPGAHIARLVQGLFGTDAVQPKELQVLLAIIVVGYIRNVESRSSERRTRRFSSRRM